MTHSGVTGPGVLQGTHLLCSRDNFWGGIRAGDPPLLANLHGAEGTGDQTCAPEPRGAGELTEVGLCPRDPSGPVSPERQQTLCN